MSAKPTLDVPAGTRIGERYRVTRTLGTGSMGAVFQAETDAGGQVAVKVLLPMRGVKDASEARARFEREAQVTRSLVHPNIAPVLDFGVDAALEAPFLVMPLLEGEDLAAAIEREGALDPRVVVPLFVQAARGLAAAHAEGVVHRDVKPSNLFLARDAAGLITVKVVDFGLAKADDTLTGGTLTASNRFMGTPHYVSPEQATNAKRVDARSDLWSLAMSMYHALAGVPAFERAGSLLALVVEVTGSRGVRPVQVPAPWIDPAIARVVHCALVRDPAQRCPSGDEFALALEMAVGFDAARARVAATGVVRVPEEVRRRVAAPARMPVSWDDLLRA